MIAFVDKKQAPLIPMNRPKPAHEMKLKKGNVKIQKYIEKPKSSPQIGFEPITQ